VNAVHTAVGKFGMSISPSWVEYIIEPLGSRIASGDGVIRQLITGKSWKKTAVLPVSAMTLVEVLKYNGVGGPKGGSYNIVSTSLQFNSTQ
jgi:hypothetical protein